MAAKLEVVIAERSDRMEFDVKGSGERTPREEARLMAIVEAIKATVSDCDAALPNVTARSANRPEGANVSVRICIDVECNESGFIVLPELKVNPDNHSLSEMMIATSIVSYAAQLEILFYRLQSNTCSIKEDV